MTYAVLIVFVFVLSFLFFSFFIETGSLHVALVGPKLNNQSSFGLTEVQLFFLPRSGIKDICHHI